MPASWSNGPDKTITLGTSMGMRYDQANLDVRPGQKVRLIFNNYDDMQHNIVIVKPGSTDKVGEAAARLGIAGNKMNYVPETDQVLFHSSIIQPTSNESIYFEVPAFEGDYGFVCTMPGHYMLMRGILRVRK
jgi:azurin